MTSTKFEEKQMKGSSPTRMSRLSLKLLKMGESFKATQKAIKWIIFERHYIAFMLWIEGPTKGWLWIALLLSVGWNPCHYLRHPYYTGVLYVCTKPNCIIILSLERTNWTPPTFPFPTHIWMVGIGNAHISLAQGRICKHQRLYGAFLVCIAPG